MIKTNFSKQTIVSRSQTSFFADGLKKPSAADAYVNLIRNYLANKIKADDSLSTEAKNETLKLIENDNFVLVDKQAESISSALNRIDSFVGLFSEGTSKSQNTTLIKLATYMANKDKVESDIANYLSDLEWERPIRAANGKKPSATIGHLRLQRLMGSDEPSVHDRINDRSVKLSRNHAAAIKEIILKNMGVAAPTSTVNAIDPYYSLKEFMAYL